MKMMGSEGTIETLIVPTETMKIRGIEGTKRRKSFQISGKYK